MSDPIEELTNFDPGPSMKPLTPGEVRHQGDRLRRRNTVLTAVGAAVAVAAVVAPVALIGDGDSHPQPAPAPPSLSGQVLLTQDEVPERERLGAWRTAPEPVGEVLACQPGPLSSLGADASVRRDFEAEVKGAPAEGSPTSVVRTAVLQFADAASASDAYDTAWGWVSTCPGAGDAATAPSSVTEIELENGHGEWGTHSFAAPDVCTECDAERFDRMGVAQVADRLVLVSLAEVGGPLEPEGLDASMEELFAAAVGKAGAEPSGGETGEPEPDPGAVDVPLDWDLVDMTGDGGRILGPGPKAEGVAEVSPCDRAVWPETGVDRLALTTTGPEFVESRELVVFASADQAAQIMEDVRSAIDACPTEINGQDPTSSPEQAWDVLEADTGYDDSVTFSQTYTDGLPGGQVWQLTRVGRAIIAVSTGGHYSRGASASSGAVRLTEITAHVTPEMCEFTDSGC